ncbi:MAG: glycosyltransferase family 2 protein [Nitrospirae bacterium CG_4_9_14_3_um_filter_53_35]|nr:MAG: hypothetical protein AUK29_05695 [Nitrospirae bacterium CG2_30_53_67]PIS37978.1 MAG: glycosyltransferase family 2 protein [Nitrospirae bacterium CG08_land_8_20_14_0_20_52_24]PIW85000.1 MAG: glycosyltransferase family 2 protein [Nitrospirae bacterium CG_4_8_14_3_um_filter_50_41]PIX84606.1 MAG: glycosyltransferase family 2 protein [Nitrospirae bacterium CG_4_10_14_3_um_filter_53_41]PJA77602.1 MAG: glycosyltransferase family 2 protein [Nitrospirae bacterium CG_4_9_14_3_um_filter_53_35]
MPLNEWIFWSSVAFLLFVTVCYPLLAAMLGLFRRHQGPAWSGEPGVSLIITAYNEEKHIKEKLENSLGLNYPKEKLEIIVASDGSTDRTHDMVNAFRNEGVKLYAYDRLGKTAIQNESVKKSSGEIIVFSDANAMYRKDAVRKLVANFGDERVGCVSGQLVYKKSAENLTGLCESAYWNYEKFIKYRESRISSLIGVNGSIYAIRKSDYVEIGNDLISDLVEPLEIVRHGKKVVYEPEAISEEESSATYREEFERKIRIFTRTIHGLFRMKALLNPFQYGIFSIQLWIHKIFRYLMPFALLSAALSLIFLTDRFFYYILYCLMITTLIFAMIAKFTEYSDKRNWFFNVIYYSLTVNFALVLAWLNVLKGKTITIWPTERGS